MTLSLLLTPDIAAAVNISAGSVTAAAGEAAAVPITISLGSADVEIFAVTFTVVPQEGASAITGKLTYQAASPPGAPQLTNNSVPGTFAMGYLTGISPPLTGTLAIGTLTVPIPAGATGMRPEAMRCDFRESAPEIPPAIWSLSWGRMARSQSARHQPQPIRRRPRSHRQGLPPARQRIPRPTHQLRPPPQPRRVSAPATGTEL